MADPLTIVGTVGAVLGIVDVLAKTISSVSQLREQWKLVDTVVITFELQLTSMHTALSQIKDWADANSGDPHYQLAIDLDRCLSHCQSLVSIIEAEMDDLRNKGDQSVASKIQFLFKTQGMVEVQKMMDHVTAALNLLLTACNSASLLEQKSVVENSATRRKIKKVEEDARSLLVHRDTDSLRSFFTATWSLRSSKRSVLFDFDPEILPSRIYRRVLQGSIKESLRRQQGAFREMRIRRSNKEEGGRHLYLACQNGNEEEIRSLIKNGVDINDGGIHVPGNSPLFQAAKDGRTPIVKLLLELRADTEVRDKRGWTPLIEAAHCGYTEVVKLLLEFHADIKAEDGDWRTPLMYAAKRGRKSTVELLLESQADIEAVDINGWTPLAYAAVEGKNEVVQLLLAEGAYIESCNADGNTPLTLAAERGHTETAEILLSKGANKENCNLIGRTPLASAARHGHIQTLELLISSGARVEAKDLLGRTALFDAISVGALGGSKMESVTNYLLDVGADIEARDRDGRTPLSYAAQFCRAKAVELLLKRGADATVRDNEGHTPLKIAQGKGRQEVERLLTEASTKKQQS
ncbi:hypothetical protein OQA88_3210 [Cercophora sp. LCS_1]